MPNNSSRATRVAEATRTSRELLQLTRNDRGQQVSCEATQPLARAALELAFVARVEQCRMFAADLFCRSAIGEVIQCKRFACHAFRTLQRIGVAVIGKVCRTEDHYPVKPR